MLNVQVKDDYAAILTPLQESVDEALRRYALEKTRSRIMELEQRLENREQKYGCSYDLFAYRTSTDEGYVKQLDSSSATQEWEGDLIAWEFDVTELREWRHYFRRLSTKQVEWGSEAEFAREIIA